MRGPRMRGRSDGARYADDDCPGDDGSVNVATGCALSVARLRDNLRAYARIVSSDVVR